LENELPARENEELVNLLTCSVYSRIGIGSQNRNYESLLRALTRFPQNRDRPCAEHVGWF